MLTVSCLCPTYNRAPDYLGLVEEAIESFLRQDYPAKELIVLNDTPGQRLHFDHPQVRIVNTPFRCQSMGDKRNMMAGLAAGDLLCPWDDDDIQLPWRLARSVELLGDADYYNPEVYWMLTRQGLLHEQPKGWGYTAAIHRKRCHHELGGMPSISMGEDKVMDGKLRTCRLARHPPLPLEEWFQIVRWGVSPIHLSSRSGDTLYASIGARPICAGDFVPKPHWQQDYVALTRARVAALRTPCAAVGA